MRPLLAGLLLACSRPLRDSAPAPACWPPAMSLPDSPARSRCSSCNTASSRRRRGRPAAGRDRAPAVLLDAARRAGQRQLRLDRLDSVAGGAVRQLPCGRGSEPPARLGRPAGRRSRSFWGRIYREHDEVLVQSYLRFLRVAPDELRFADERFAVDLSDPPAHLEGSLPTQSIAFAPRRLSAERLDRIDADWRPRRACMSGPTRAQRPRTAAARGAFRLFRARDEGRRLARRRAVARGGPGLAEGRSRGPSIPARAAARARLRRRRDRLSELSPSRRWPRLSRPPAPWMLERIAARFARFIEPPTDEAALASTLLGALQAFTTPDRRRRAWSCSGGAAPAAGGRQAAQPGRHGRAAPAAPATDAGPALKQVPQMLLAGLAVEPNNGDLLANLQTTYAWLAGQPGGARARRGPGDRRGAGQCQPARRTKQGCPCGRVGGGRQPNQFHRYRRQRPLAARRPRRGAGRVRRGASRSWSRAFRAGMRQGYRDHTLRGAPFWSTGADQFPALAQLFQTLAQAQRVGVEADAPRLAAAGLSAAEVGARLAEIEDLRHALGELN